MTLKISIILGIEPGPLFRSCTWNSRRTGCQGKGNGGEYGRGKLYISTGVQSTFSRGGKFCQISPTGKAKCPWQFNVQVPP